LIWSRFVGKRAYEIESENENCGSLTIKVNQNIFTSISGFVLPLRSGSCYSFWSFVMHISHLLKVSSTFITVRKIEYGCVSTL
jgi:hypothetical protein